MRFHTRKICLMSETSLTATSKSSQIAQYITGQNPVLGELNSKTRTGTRRFAALQHKAACSETTVIYVTGGTDRRTVKQLSELSKYTIVCLDRSAVTGIKDISKWTGALESADMIVLAQNGLEVFGSQRQKAIQESKLLSLIHI